MANKQNRSRIGVKRPVLFAVLMLAVICCLGFVYVNGQAPDWSKLLTAGPEALSEWRAPEQIGQRSEARFMPPSFDIASVDEKGALIAAGRGEAGWTVQLKSQSQILGETKADERQEWVLTLETPLAPGEHALSLLAIDPSGRRKIAGERESRVTIAPRQETVQAAQMVAETPPSRQASIASSGFALTPRAPQGAGKEPCASAVVKRGDTLWAIAHHCYGSGTKYTRIFRSNRSVIRKPRLIYPDQRLAVPH